MQANRRLSAQWLRLQRANGFKNEILGTGGARSEDIRSASSSAAPRC